jgi:hypothetical protein
MWIMVEPVAEIPFGIRRSPTRCYGCNKCNCNRIKNCVMYAGGFGGLAPLRAGD